jgi:hypothetical protein
MTSLFIEHIKHASIRHLKERQVSICYSGFSARTACSGLVLRELCADARKGVSSPPTRLYYSIEKPRVGFFCARCNNILALVSESFTATVSHCVQPKR